MNAINELSAEVTLLLVVFSFFLLITWIVLPFIVISMNNKAGRIEKKLGRILKALEKENS